MKILWISPWFGNYRVPLYDELNKLSGGNFYLICSKKDTSDLVREKLKRTLGDNVVIMEGEKNKMFGKDTSDFANSGLVIRKQPGLYSKIKAINPDILVCIGFGGWSPVAIRYSLLHRKKLCMVYERTKHVERNCPFWRIWWRRIVGRVADLFFINGSLCEEYLNDVLWYKRKPKVKGCMVADSHELAKAVSAMTEGEKTSLRGDLQLSDGLTFLFVGQMVERKGIKELLAAWTKHIKTFNNDNLIVIGSGVLKEELVKKYKDCASIHILGGISYDRIHKYYGLCDVFVMPTLEDNWCLVVPEAMACGKPVACSVYNGGYVELVKEGVNGFSFDPLKEESILNVLRKYHGGDLQTMGKASVEIEKEYWPEVAAGKMIAAMNELLEDKI